MNANESKLYCLRKEAIKACGLLACLWVAYWPSLNGEFFHFWDDARWIRDVAKLAQEEGGLRRIWTELGAVEQYYPLTATTFWLDRHLWGDWPLPYHVQNVLWHGLSSLLIVVFMRQLRLPGAWLAATVFALHPMMVESVAWITERKNVLSLPLFLGALIASAGFASWADRPPPNRARWLIAYALTFLLFLAAMLAKVSTFVFPAAVPLLGWWRTGRIAWRRDVLSMAPFFVVALVLALVVHHVEVTVLGAGAAFPKLEPAQQLLLASRIPWFYAAQFFWPREICVMYPRWEIDSAFGWSWLYPLATILLLTSAWLVRHRLGRGPWTALLLFGGALLPVSGLFQVYGMVLAWVADRWAYLPILALLLPVAAQITTWTSRGSLPIRRMALGTLVLGLGVATWHSADRFRDERSLWEATLKANPECWPACNNLGNLADKEGRHEEAARWFLKGLQFDPGNPDMTNNLGNAYLKNGQAALAIEKLTELVARKPQMAVAHHNLGLAWLELGKAEEALKAFEQAMALKPEFVPSQLKRADLLLALGKVEEAEAQYLAVLKVSPQDAEALVSLGNLCFSTNRHAEALDFFQRTLQAAPGDPVALNNLAWLLANTPLDRLRDAERAVALAQQALAASPKVIPEYRQTLVLALAACQRYQEAAKEASRAADEARLQNKLGLAEQMIDFENRMRQMQQLKPPANPVR